MQQNNLFLKKLTVALLVKKIPTLFINTKVHYIAHKSPLLEPILNQMTLVHILTPYFLEIRIYNILPPTPKPPKWFIPVRFSGHNFEFISHPSDAHYMPSICKKMRDKNGK
jgi:hypothetical protein